MGLLEKRLYENVFLTKTGKELAKERYQALRRLGNKLETNLALPSDIAKNAPYYSFPSCHKKI